MTPELWGSILEGAGGFGFRHPTGFAPDGQWLVTASEDQTVRIWRAATGKSVAVLPHEAEVMIAIFSPGGPWIVTGTEDRVVRVWDTTSRKKVSEIDRRDDAPARARTRAGAAPIDRAGTRALFAGCPPSRR